ncbi:Pectate lyase H [Cytospora mali]|uniref:Pectate lyase n=1 Tax=Cytospora mali TaxID=578113 RepID=A0A194UXZ7_CYTMA|nr:Pectate lyase H [Valsa mali var. pyri (nom. inval.)]
MQFSMSVVMAALAIGAVASPAPMVTPAPEARDVQRRFNLPASKGSTVLKAVSTIKAGQSFDGGMKVFDRGVKCTGQAESGAAGAVFKIEEGGTLSNVIIGPNQVDGIHCHGRCTLNNVWWSNVCEDAFTIKEQDAGDTTYIKGGGAYSADDKVLQHNGAGTLSVSNFVVEDFGKLYRACGNCKNMYERHVILNGITATSGKELCGINSNYGDTCVVKGKTLSGVKNVCSTYSGTNNNSKEPTKNNDNEGGCDGKYCVC